MTNPVAKSRPKVYTKPSHNVIIIPWVITYNFLGEGESMKIAEDTLILQETEQLLIEIEDLKQKLNYERQQHRHWEELAMLFHDALWNELKKVNHSKA